MSVRTRLADNVLPTTVLLSVVSLALVFAAALGAVPAGLLPRAPAAVLAAIPHVNAAASLTALGTIAVGVRAIRDGQVERHRRAMLATLGLFALFLVLYLYRVALLGPTEFPGSGTAETVYLAILAVHVLLAIVCVPLVIYVVLLGTTRSIPEIRRSNHARVGRVAATLWAVSFFLGVVVYALLYHLY